MAVFENLQLWIDPVKRPGPENMAVDEWLLEKASHPLLRIYGWQENWGSLGYFGNLADARALFPGLQWVRRLTGGGIVDHRNDWTYTLVVPLAHPLATIRGSASYEIIHKALAAAISNEGMSVILSGGDGETGAAGCFSNPVNYDVVSRDGLKIAGAGQKRSATGLLHQGSVAGAASGNRAATLVSTLATRWEPVDVQPPARLIQDLVDRRYAKRQWTEKR